MTGPRDLERAINEADKLDVIDADALRKALDERPGEMGVGSHEFEVDLKYEPRHVRTILEQTAAHLRGSLHPH